MVYSVMFFFFFFSSRRRHTRFDCDWSSDVCSSDLWPLEALVAPLVAASPAAFASRLPAALLVLAVHYVWVVRSTLAFEEAAVEHAARMARRIEAARQGRWGERSMRAQQTTGPIRLRLAPTGAPARAIPWKNALGATRDFSPRTPAP